ncbi:MAG: hypothetical protein K8T89_23925 [Planctomycetes bacterium]|nr:hypothetical protein [Planctomycetota bacterium]
MKCQPIRNRILAVDELGILPAELAMHLADCAACRTWHRKFMLVDRSLKRVPVPESNGMMKNALLEKIRTVPAPIAPPMTTHEGNGRTSAKPLPMPIVAEPSKKKYSFRRLTENFWPAGLVAATLVIGMVAWLSLRNNRLPPPAATPNDPLLNSLVKLNVELAKSLTAEEQVVVLARVAGELNHEMRQIARADATGENMQALEKMYKKVVIQGLVAQARRIDRSKREAVLFKIVDELDEAEKNARQMADESPQHSAQSLIEAADTARDGTKTLRRLIRESLS